MVPTAAGGMMNTTDRIVAMIPGLIFLGIALQWIFDPAAAAEGLGLPLLDGLARSTEIGDLGAFFVSLSGMILWGAATANPLWLRAAATLVGSAAVIRTLAWGVHGADFAAAFITVEVVVTILLLTVASRIVARR